MLHRLIDEDVALVDPRGGAPRARACRPRSIRAGAREPRHQRARCDASRRRDPDRDASSISTYPGPPSSTGGGKVCHPQGLRHRNRDVQRDEGPHLRALLHHQGAGQGHRPRARDRLRHRRAGGRKGHHRLRGRAGNDLLDLLSDDRRFGRAGFRRARSRAARARRRRRARGPTARTERARGRGLSRPRSRERPRGARVPGAPRESRRPDPDRRRHARHQRARARHPPRGARALGADPLHVGLRRQQAPQPRPERADDEDPPQAVHAGGAHRPGSPS